MKKIFTLFAALVCMAALNAKTIYLNTGGSELWNQADAVFFAHSWASETDNADVQLTLVSGDIYSAEINDAHGNILFVRMPANSIALDWNTKWNKTADLSIPADKNQYNITGWGENDGNWSAYTAGGGDNPGGGGGDNPGIGGDKDYLLKGWCNGKDIETPGAEELFEGGMLTYEFTGDANFHKGWFFILVCDPGQVIGEQYMTKGVDAESGTHTTLYKDGFEKFGAPEGTVTFYLYDNGDGTLELSIEPLEGKTLVGGGEEGTKALQYNTVSEKAYKTIINGQLRIVRGDKVFDVTGRQL